MELNRTQVEELLIVKEGGPYARAHEIVLAHDKAQRAKLATQRDMIQWQAERIGQLERYAEQMRKELSEERRAATE